MKKLLILFLLIANYSFSQPSSWAAIAANQEISEYASNWAMVQSPYLQLKAPLPNGLSSLHCLTKAQLIASFYVDVTNTTLAAKASNQIVAKRDITPLSFTSYYAHNLSNAQSSGASACGTTLSNVAPVYTSVNTAPTIGTVFYTNSSLTTTFGGSNLWWLVTYSTGNYYVVQINGVGSVIATYACATPPSHT
jgi:hypothetical protein